MDGINIHKKIDIVDPVMIAGWPGMGSVALGVVDYLRRKLAATEFADIKLDPASTIDSVVVEHGVARLPGAPRNVFYYTRKPDFILCEGEAQLSGSAGVDLLAKALDLAQHMNVKAIYTGAAFPMPVSYKDATEVYYAVNRKEMASPYSRLRLHPMDGGHISGLNGLMLGYAGERGIGSVCLLATMPQYAIGLPNPRATKAIIEALQKTLRFNISLEELDELAHDMDEKMALIEEKVKDVFTMDKEDAGPVGSGKKVPEYIMDKVEKLFQEARLDRAKAIFLKKELDRWDLYKVYEDRFLDLFRESQ